MNNYEEIRQFLLDNSVMKHDDHQREVIMVKFDDALHAIRAAMRLMTPVVGGVLTASAPVAVAQPETK